MNRILWCAAALAIATSASAQIYKWVDKDGKVQYSDSPPPAVQTKQLNINVAPPTPGISPAQAAVNAANPPAKNANDAQDASKKGEDTAKVAAAKEERCNQATAAFKSLDQETRISRTDAKGERYYLDDNQREAEKARARKAMDESCVK